VPHCLSDRLAPEVCLPPIRTEFYREELVKHQQCLKEQRDSYSEEVMCSMEAALSRLFDRLEHLCRCGEADHVVSCVLRQFDALTRLSTSSPPTETH
jgi:hypothetical protein